MISQYYLWCKRILEYVVSCVNLALGVVIKWLIFVSVLFRFIVWLSLLYFKRYCSLFFFSNYCHTVKIFSINWCIFLRCGEADGCPLLMLRQCNIYTWSLLVFLTIYTKNMSISTMLFKPYFEKPCHYLLMHNKQSLLQLDSKDWVLKYLQFPQKWIICDFEFV